jgi:dTDP-4-amino-4,6-dideoxygalactose transaminase
MIARGQFHIKATSLFKSFLRLLSSDYQTTNSVSSFNDQLQSHLGASQGQLFSSCRIAFYSYLKSLNLNKGSEVLLSPITIPDIVNAIILNGLRPVFVEMDINDHSMDIEDLAKKITNDSCIVLSTSLSGLSPKNKDLRDFCDEHELLYIEDISQAPIKMYFDSSFTADVAIISLSIGKTISTLVGGAIYFKNKTKKIDYNPEVYPEKSYFLRQLVENLKIDVFTNSFVYRSLTRHILKFSSLINPSYYFNIHKYNLVSKFNENDIFFDDIPVLRKEFPDNLFFRFNHWMAKLGLETMSYWDESLNKRRELKSIFMAHAEDLLKSKVATNFIENDYFTLRVPIYIDNPENFQLFCIGRGLDVGNYGLNLCNEEAVFSKFKADLPKSRYIKENCFFLNLNEKSSANSILKSVNILNDYFRSNP